MANSLSTSTLVIDGLFKSELNLPWSSARVVLHHNWLISGVVYNGIIVYKTARVAEGLERYSVVRGKFLEASDLQYVKLVAG